MSSLNFSTGLKHSFKAFSDPLFGIEIEGMEKQLVHYYNVISGECVCGADVSPEKKTFSVFPEKVNCDNCLEALGKSEGQ